MKKRNTLLLLLSFTIGFLSSCGIQSIPRANNEVEAGWSEVVNQYKRREDLVPNLVNVVKGYAKHENQTLLAVTEARTKATQVNIDPSKLTPEAMTQFQNAQGALSQSLSKLLVVVEKYPDLKANENFRDLQAQLEGTENRITTARRRYIESVKEFNNLVTVFPYSLTNSIFFKFDKKPQFTVENATEIQKAPEVKFP